MLAERRGTLPVANQRGLRHRGEHLRQGAGMVQFGVIADDVVDARRFDQRGDVLQQLVGKGRFDGVDQRGLVVANEVGVVGRAPLGVVAVEIADRPIDGADPIDVLAKRCVHAQVTLGVWIVSRLLNWRRPCRGATAACDESDGESRRRPARPVRQAPRDSCPERDERTVLPWPGYGGSMGMPLGKRRSPTAACCMAHETPAAPGRDARPSDS